MAKIGIRVMNFVQKISPWVSDVFHVTLTLWLAAALIEILRPATITSSIDLVLILYVLLSLGIILMATKTILPAPWLVIVDVILVAMILWVIPQISFLVRAAFAAFIFGALFFYFQYD